MREPLIYSRLSQSDSIVHIGAHYAEERFLYNDKQCSVMWIEANNKFSRVLHKNLEEFENQEFRICALDCMSNKKRVFFISNNNDGVSSSFYEFGDAAQELWPNLNLHHVDETEVITQTFDEFVELEIIWFRRNAPKALLIDVQGAEIDVLKGALGSLWRFKYIQIKTSSANVYENGNTRDDIIYIMQKHGFNIIDRYETVEGHGDILFEKVEKANHDFAFDSLNYQKINKARIEHLDSLDLSFKGKTILELGSGPGDIAEYLLKEGAYVTSVDGREENIKSAYSKHAFKKWNGYVYDLEKNISPGLTKYDIIIAYGILYHLSDPKAFIQRIQSLNSQLFLLSTCVTSEFNENHANSNQAGICLIPEPSSNGTQALNGLGCRPNRRWLWRLLQNNFDEVYACRWQPNHDQFPSDWSDISKHSSLTRMIFICSQSQLVYDWVTSRLPIQQTKKLFSAMDYGVKTMQEILSEKYLHYPKSVSIETLVACNAKCSFCAYPDSERKGEKLDADTFYKIIDELNTGSNYPKSITLARINEPLLDKRLQEFSEHILRIFPETNYSIWSNGSQLDARNMGWIEDLTGLVSLHVSLNSIDQDEHDNFMGIRLENVASNLDAIHKRSFTKCHLHAPFVNHIQGEGFKSYCKKRWPKFSSHLRPIFDWMGDVPRGESSAKEHLKLEAGYSNMFKDSKILSQPCAQWNSLHILASGQVTKCCIDEAGYDSDQFNVAKNNVLEIYAKTMYLREAILKRSNVTGCEKCLHPG